MGVPAIFQKRLVIVAGKGGVGKSTVSAAMALAAARSGRRVLVCEIHGAERMTHFFEHEPIGSKITEIRPNLFAVNVQPKEAMREYALMRLPLKALYRFVFENRLVSRFLAAMPGLNELVMLGKVWYHVVEERERGGKPRWDLVVVDAPATGHGVYFLEFPRVVLDAITSGPIAEHAKKQLGMLTDPEITSLQIVTLPEEMPVREAIDLRRDVEALNIPIGHLVVNAVCPALFNKREYEDFKLLRELAIGRNPELDRMFEAARWRIERWRNQQIYHEQIRRSLQLPRLELPIVYQREFRANAIELLASKLENQLRSAG